MINSKQFPFRFFSAYDVLDNLIKDYETNRMLCNNFEQFLKIFKSKNKNVVEGC